MTTTRVLVMNGEIMQGTDEHNNAPWYQLTGLDGVPVTTGYRGQADVSGNRLYIYPLEEYVIADKPSERCLQYNEGFRFAMAQKRRNDPGERSEAFRNGWLQAWQERKAEKNRKSA